MPKISEPRPLPTSQRKDQGEKPNLWCITPYCMTDAAIFFNLHYTKPHRRMLGNLSVYGYDHRMLANNTPTLAADRQEPNNSVVTSLDQPPCSSKIFPLLRLPIELREKIFELVLPHTTDAGTRGIAWVRGHCAILATSRRVFNEGIRIMYGRNTFVIDVVWDGVTFAYQWLLPTGLIPKRTFAFPDKLAKRNLSHIRNLLIRIHHVDNYTGMIKHNFSGPGLRQGLRLQVEKLCQETLQDMYEISHLHIHFQNDSHKMSVDQQILEPLMQLTKTRALQLTGSITPGMQRALQAQLSDAYSRNSIFYLPSEIRELIYDLALPYSKAYLNEVSLKTVVWVKGSTELLRTCAMIHKEASEVLYRSRDFELVVLRGISLRYRFLRQSNPPLFTDFPHGLGVSHVLKLKRCVLHWNYFHAYADEERRMEEITRLLEVIMQLLLYSPNITRLSVNCDHFPHNSKSSVEDVRQALLRFSGAIKIEVHDRRDVGKKSKVCLRPHTGSSSLTHRIKV